MSKTVLIFGAMGFVGVAVTKLLEERGDRVIKVGHAKNDRLKLLRNYPRPECYSADVGNYAEVRQVVNGLKHDEIAVDNVIYVVGNYEKNGYLKRLPYTFSTLPHAMFMNELMTQSFGVFSVFQTMLPVITDGGSIVFVSSSYPENLSHDIISYDGQERLIRHMRRDPAVKERGIKIHHLGFTGIATDYYHGVSETDRRRLFPPLSAAQEIAVALDWPVSDSWQRCDYTGL
ncbi:MAG: SDR family NAD(P)-dependent oxidoreductase [Parcubacteria group bacterium]|nr:SDR family NAD(P)-dependent oxidoreductase [Parcubacteria group bacterium]